MDRASQVRAILSTRGLTLYTVSRKSADLFGRGSEFYIPHNLYSTCARQSPSICQLLALSQISNYRLADWLLVFGFELDRILRLPLVLPRRSTTILDSEVYDPDAWVPWFTEKPTGGPLAPIAPLGRFVAPAPARRAGELLAANQRKFLYAAIGDRDFYAFPYFVAGSVIRADPLRVSELPGGGERFFLVEHSSGWNCSRLIALGQARVLLHCPQRPCLERELRIGRDARILGAVDAEIRPMIPCAGIWESRKEPLPAAQPGDLPSEVRLKDLLRQSRLKAGISFREASTLSGRVAATLGDKLYFAAASTLSDYETLSTPPRQIQKMITLCVLYGIPFKRFLGACGLLVDPSGREPIPSELLARPTAEDAGWRVPIASNEVKREASGPLRMLLDEWQEVPLFLRFWLDELSGLNKLTLSDMFWVGGEKAARHPLLADACLVTLNRRARKLAPLRTAKGRRGSLHMVLVRDGDYMCGPCSLEGDYLVVDGYPRAGLTMQRFRNRIDAEVVGQVTAILRRLG